MAEWVLTDLRAALAAAIPTATIFAGRLPPTPDACIALVEARASARRYPDYATPTVAVVVRGASQAAATALSAQCWTALRAIRNQTLTSGVRYVAVMPLGSAVDMRRDDSRRTLVSFEVGVWKDDAS